MSRKRGTTTITMEYETLKDLLHDEVNRAVSWTLNSMAAERQTELERLREERAAISDAIRKVRGGLPAHRAWTAAEVALVALLAPDDAATEAEGVNDG